jgi:CheY-like chemotaxis protein
VTHNPLSILLVEDDVAHAEITRRNLEELGLPLCELVHVGDGQDAIDYLTGVGSAQPSAALPQLILLDLRLPRVDGLEVLSHVKRDVTLHHIPVVVLTTSEADADVRDAYRRGASGYLVKPIVFEQFLELTRAFGAFWLRFNRYADA